MPKFSMSVPAESDGCVPIAELGRRMARFRELLVDRQLDAAFIIDPRNVRYLSGFTGDDSAALITRHGQFLLTDFRYIDEAARTAKGWTVVIKPHGLMEKCGAVARRRRVKRLGIEPGAMRLTDLPPLRKACDGKVKLIRAPGLVGELRLQKSEWEVQRIEEAIRIQERCFRMFCKELKVGVSERDAAARLHYLLVTHGADDLAFDTLFQVDASSSLPHGRPTQRTLTTNSMVLCDWGVRKAGYHSDLTRMFFFGKIDSKLRELHRIVREAQLSVFAKLAPGVDLAEIDKAAHKVIDKAGYKENFGHSTGHGIGLHIHEQPLLSVRSKGRLGEGMVVTVEPGIYLPGVCGVRLEDDVLITKTGCRILSSLPASLRWDGSDD
jgi:Xaa-Pro aminopeptidase